MCVQNMLIKDEKCQYMYCFLQTICEIVAQIDKVGTSDLGRKLALFA